MLLTTIATTIPTALGYTIMTALALACIGMTIAVIRALCDR